MDASLDELCRREVVGLHRFLQDWFNGEVPATEEVLERFTDVLDPEFRMIWPDGTASERSAVVERVAAGHGAHWKSDPPFSIAITAVRGRPLSEDLCLVTYEEWQRHGEEAQGRISTALFRRDPDAPNGVRWLHVHETWLPEDAQQGD